MTDKQKAAIKEAADCAERARKVFSDNFCVKARACEECFLDKWITKNSYGVCAYSDLNDAGLTLGELREAIDKGEI